MRLYEKTLAIVFYNTCSDNLKSVKNVLNNFPNGFEFKKTNGINKIDFEGTFEEYVKNFEIKAKLIDWEDYNSIFHINEINPNFDYSGQNKMRTVCDIKRSFNERFPDCPTLTHFVKKC